jgi:hypothetical protein
MRKHLQTLSALAALTLAGCSQPVATPPPGDPSSAASATTRPSSPVAEPSAAASPAGFGAGPLDTSGTAGWYAKSSAGPLSRADATFRLTAAEFATNGSIGIQLCNSVSGYAIQFGAVPAAGGWQVGYVLGRLSPDTGVGGDPCAGNQFLTGSSFRAVASVPAGAAVRAQITQQGNGELTLTYADSGLTSFTYRVAAAPVHFNEFAAGASYAATFRGPVVSTITDFTGVSATAAGVTGGLATWDAVPVSSSQTGELPPSITASRLSPATGRAASAFAILGATPGR